MSKKGGLPTGIKMRHDAHYVEELARTQRSIGKILPIDKIAPNPDQPRVEIGDLKELSNSIRQNGVLEPLLVKPRSDGTFMIIAGERRWRAATLAGLREVPCIEFDIDEQAVAEIALIENLQRKDLTIWEEADGLAYLGEKFGYTHEDIARKIGKSRSTVTELLTIANLPDAIREKCFKAEVSAKSSLLEIARQFDEPAMHEFMDIIQSKNLNREQIRRHARPAKVSTADAPPAVKNSAAESSPGVFRFNSTDSAEHGFELEIRFAGNAAFDKKDVLRALKEVFDFTKREI